MFSVSRDCGYATFEYGNGFFRSAPASEVAIDQRS